MINYTALFNSHPVAFTVISMITPLIGVPYFHIKCRTRAGSKGKGLDNDERVY